MSKSVIACDLGTGSTKAALFRSTGKCVAEYITPYPTFYPRAGFHEQRPVDWWSSVAESIRNLLAAAGDEGANVGAIAISGHSLGCTPLSADGDLLQEQVPIWSDGRAEAEAEEFFANFDRSSWYHLTGNGFPAPLYPLFKLMWLRRHRPEIFRATRLVIGTKDYVNYRLTNVLATDQSYASGSGAYDLLLADYSEEILSAAGLPRSLFPPILSSTAVLGEVRPEVAELLGLPAHVKVVAGGVDNSCMALGAKTFEEGELYCSMGSSSWLTVSSAKPVIDDDVFPYVFAHVVPGFFISATSIFSSGTSLKWVHDLFFSAGNISAEGDSYEALIELALQSPPGANGLIFIPTLGGGTSFEGGPAVRGAFVGLDLQHRKADIVRATLEGIAMALGEALNALRRIASIHGEMIIVGGGARSAVWRQILADVLGCTIAKTGIDQQAAALGAAALALVGIGEWKNFSIISDLHVVEDCAAPNKDLGAIMTSALKVYHLAASQQREISIELAAFRSQSNKMAGG
jgi:xylulokinase